MHVLEVHKPPDDMSSINSPSTAIEDEFSILYMKLKIGHTYNTTVVSGPGHVTYTSTHTRSLGLVGRRLPLKASAGTVEATFSHLFPCLAAEGKLL